MGDTFYGRPTCEANAHYRQVIVILMQCTLMFKLIFILLLLFLSFPAYESDNKNLHNIFRNTKAIVFFSCPHLGSEVADLKMPTEKLFWPSLEVQELRYSE